MRDIVAMLRNEILRVMLPPVMRLFWWVCRLGHRW